MMAIYHWFADSQRSLDFLKSIALKVKGDEDKSAYAMAHIECAHYKLILSDLEGAEEGIKEVEKLLDGLSGIESIVNANFYRVSADYHKVILFSCIQLLLTLVRLKQITHCTIKIHCFICRV
jgi:hypothetical protein